MKLKIPIVFPQTTSSPTFPIIFDDFGGRLSAFGPDADGSGDTEFWISLCR